MRTKHVVNTKHTNTIEYNVDPKYEMHLQNTKSQLTKTQHIRRSNLIDVSLFDEYTDDSYETKSHMINSYIRVDPVWT